MPRGGSGGGRCTPPRPGGLRLAEGLGAGWRRGGPGRGRGAAGGPGAHGPRSTSPTGSAARGGGPAPEPQGLAGRAAARLEGGVRGESLVSEVV